MKSIYLGTLIIFLSCCRGTNVIETADTTPSIELLKVDFNSYEVMKIDSIKNIYLIYAKKDGFLFKIASKKEETENCDKIEVNGKYGFHLESLFPKNFLGKYDLSPKSLPHVTGVDFYGTTITLEGDSISDLYIAHNIKGLCFIK
jgi:hypothetical protein